MEYGEKILLTRSNVGRSYNSLEIEDCAIRKGYEVVDLSRHSLLEQFAIMCSIKFFIGPTGASLANLIFCQPNTVGLTWMHPEWGNFPAYSTLSKISNVNLLYLNVDSANGKYYGDYYLEESYFSDTIDSVENGYLVENETN